MIVDIQRKFTPKITFNTFVHRKVHGLEQFVAIQLQDVYKTDWNNFTLTRQWIEIELDVGLVWISITVSYIYVIYSDVMLLQTKRQSINTKYTKQIWFNVFVKGSNTIRSRQSNAKKPNQTNKQTEKKTTDQQQSNDWIYWIQFDIKLKKVWSRSYYLYLSV